MSGAASILLLDPDGALKTSVAALSSRGFTMTTAKTAEEATRRLATRDDEVLLLNIDSAGGPALLEARRGDGSPVPVIAVTKHPAVATAVAALRASAIDYLSTPIRQSDLLAAIERAIERNRAQKTLHGVEHIASACVRWFRDAERLLTVTGGLVVPPSLRHALLEQRDAAALDQVLERCLGAPEIAALTRREREVLVAFAQGQRGRDLAKCLGVSVNTCRTHLKSLLRKTGVHSQRELLARLQGGPPHGVSHA